MIRKLVAGISAFVMISPVLVSADAVSHDTQFVAIYSQLVQLLQKELLLLQSQPVSHASLDFSTSTGKAPLLVFFTLHNGNGTEAIDYGDGHSSGSNGCARNSQGWCDFSVAKTHTYELPGTYKVTVYSHPTPKTLKVENMYTVSVTQ